MYSRTIIIIVVAVLAVAIASCAIVLGITNNGSNEKTFLHPCFDEIGKVEMFNSKCDPGVWKQGIPICMGYSGDEGQGRMLSFAAAEIKSQFRTEIFKSCDVPHVIFNFNVPHEQNRFEKLDYVQHRMSPDGTMRANVFVGNTSSDPELWYVLLHSMGHVLFLKHDDYPSSIMYPHVPEDLRTRPLNPMSFPHFSDNDVRAIRDMYL